MVADKAQVRATVPIDPTTRQPVQGRQRNGGIRLGEMERDALIAHGTSFLVHDRLMRCSDYTVGHICPCCGSLITPTPRQEQRFVGGGANARAMDTVAAALEAVCLPFTHKQRVENPCATEVKCVESISPSYTGI